VRIVLIDREQEQRRRRKGRKRRRRSRAFNSSITLPQTKSQKGADRPYRPRGKRSARPRAQNKQGERQTATRLMRGIRWRTVLVRLPAFLILVALVGVIVYASMDQSFYVYEAQILGARHLEAQTIYDQAQVDEHSIFWIQPREVAERIVQLDGVKAVRVQCTLPAALTIEVEEREPVVMWRAKSQNTDWWLDEEGVVLPYHGDPNSPDMVFVVDSSPRSLQVGDHMTPEGIVQSVLQLASTLPSARVFFYEQGRGLYFTQGLGQGEWPVYVGTSQDLPRKIQVVQTLTDYLVVNNVRPSYVDVRWPEHPVYGKPDRAETGGGD
jgi:cell division septal protein FtsQ